MTRSFIPTLLPGMGIFIIKIEINYNVLLFVTSVILRGEGTSQYTHYSHPTPSRPEESPTKPRFDTSFT